MPDNLKEFIITFLFISFLTGLAEGFFDRCSFNSRVAIYNPGYLFGCWLTETVNEKEVNKK